MTVKFQHLTEALQFYDPEFYDYLKDRQVRGAVVRGRPDVTVEKRPLPSTHSDTQTVCRVATKTPIQERSGLRPNDSAPAERPRYTYMYPQCPRIGKFGWETTPYGYYFSTLSL